MTAATAVALDRPSFAALRAAVAAVVADSPESPHAGAEAVELVALQAQLDAARLARMRVVQRAQEGSGQTTASWFRSRARLPQGRAHAELSLADALDARLPAAGAALAAGSITLPHAQAVQREAAGFNAAVVSELEQEFVRIAETHDPVSTGRQVRALLLQHDPDGGTRTEEQHRAARSFRFSDRDGMVAVSGLLTAEVGAKGRAVLHALGRSDRDSGDTRTTEQRAADAFEQLLDGRLSGGAGGVQLIVTATVDALADEPGAAPARLAGGAPLPSAALARIACDAVLRGMLFDGAGEPLWLGRAKRTRTPAQWAAVVARDGGCVAEGCDRGIEWCQLHHVLHFTRGGCTDVDELVAFCTVHHHVHHDSDQPILHRDGRWMTKDGWTPGPRCGDHCIHRHSSRLADGWLAPGVRARLPGPRDHGDGTGAQPP